MHNQAFEGLEAWSVKDTISKPWEKVSDTVLAHTVDTLNIGAILALIAQKYLTAHAYHVHLMLITVSIEEAWHLSWDKVHFLHLLERLCDKLFSRENPSLQPIVRLDILDVGIWDIASVELEIFLLWIVLYHHSGFDGWFIFCLKVGCLTIKLLYFLNYRDEETACVLVMWHNS